jgi:hypothetical protein
MTPSGRKLSTVQRRDIQDVTGELRAQGLSPSTIDNLVDPLRVIVRRAIRRDGSRSSDQRSREAGDPRPPRPFFASTVRARANKACQAAGAAHCGAPP